MYTAIHTFMCISIYLHIALRIDADQVFHLTLNINLFLFSIA